MRGARTGDVADHQAAQQLDDLMGQLIVHIAQQRLAAHVHQLVGYADPLLDVFRDQAHDADGQIFFRHGCRALSVLIGRIGGTFEWNLHVAAEIRLADAAQDLIILPRGADDRVHQGGHRHLAVRGGVLGQKGAALPVVLGDHVTGIGVNIRLAGSDFLQRGGGLFGAHGTPYGAALEAFSDGLPGLGVIFGRLADLFLRGLQGADFFFQGLQICAFLFHLHADLGAALFDFLQGLHVCFPPCFFLVLVIAPAKAGSCFSVPPWPPGPASPAGSRRSLPRRNSGKIFQSHRWLAAIRMKRHIIFSRP